MGGTLGGGLGCEGGAAEHKERVIDGEARGAASKAKSGGSSRERGIIKVAKAEADGTPTRGAGGKESISKGAGEGMAEDRVTHEKNVIKETIENRIARTREGDAPGTWIRAVDHG